VDPAKRFRLCLVALSLTIVGGAVGYVALGLSVLDAFYQTITTISTVGFRDVEPLTSGAKVFTIVLILVGVGTTLYTFTVLLELVIEGHLRELLGRRRMEREIGKLDSHVIVCGWGRVGRAIADYVARAGIRVVVIDRDEERLATVPYLWVRGDVTEDEVLQQAGITGARVLVAAVNTDADNLYVTLSSRTLRPDLVIIARARTESSEAKLRRAGADRVVNPQRIGGDRMAAFAVQPHVVDFLDVVMHDGSLEFRLEEVVLDPRSSIAGASLRDAQIRDRTGALILALRKPDGEFLTNPDPATVIAPDHILIAIGTAAQLSALVGLAGGRVPDPSR
jgi:voltage-gated potassium channel